VRLHRRACAGVGATLRSGGGIAANASARSCYRVLVVVTVSLVTRTGQILHSELVPVVVPVAARLAARSPGGPKRWAEEVIERLKPRVLQHAIERAQPGLASAVTRMRAQMEMAAARERSMVATLAPAAQRLVQAGLFDRRAVNESKRRQAAATLLIDDAAARLATDAAPEIATQATIVALRGWRGLEAHPTR
jgi:hypothetical protein